MSRRYLEQLEELAKFNSGIKPVNDRITLIRTLQIMENISSTKLNNAEKREESFRRIMDWIRKVIGEDVYNNIIYSDDVQLFENPSEIETDLKTLTLQRLLKEDPNAYFRLIGFPSPDDEVALKNQQIIVNDAVEKKKKETLSLYIGELQKKVDDIDASLPNDVDLEALMEYEEVSKKDLNEAAVTYNLFSEGLSDYESREVLEQSIVSLQTDLYRIYRDEDLQNIADQYVKASKNKGGVVLRKLTETPESLAAEFNVSVGTMIRVLDKIEDYAYLAEELERRQSDLSMRDLFEDLVESERRRLNNATQYQDRLYYAQAIEDLEQRNELNTKIRHLYRYFISLPGEMSEVDLSALDKKTDGGDNLENYLDSAPINEERIKQTIDDMQINKRVYINNFNNDERRILKEKLIEKYISILRSVPASEKVLITFGRLNKSDNVSSELTRTVPGIHDRDEALEFLTNWTNEGIEIKFDEQTHIKLTEGDRESVAKMWTCDWFQIFVPSARLYPLDDNLFPPPPTGP